MNKSNTGFAKPGKDDQHNFATYIDELKSRLDIVQIAEIHGISMNKNLQADCFNGHDEKTPSLKFYGDSQSYHCFGCGAHGDVISLVQKITNRSFWESVNDLAQQAGMAPFPSNNGFNPEQYADVSACLNAAAEIYDSWLSPDDDYLKQRGISYDTAQQFMVGRTRGKHDLVSRLRQKGFSDGILWSSGLMNNHGQDFFQDHVIVPIMNHGRVVNFYGRSLNNDDGQRHWRLPNGRMKVGDGLFNWNPRSDEMILVEGPFDALALIENGFPHAVATLGTQGLNGSWPTIRKGQIKKAFVCYDGDPSGNTAALRTAYDLEGCGINSRVVDMPQGQDPNEFFRHSAAEDFQTLLDSSLPPFHHELREIGVLESRDEQLTMIRDSLLPKVKRSDPIMQPDLVKKIHEKLGIPVKALNEQLKKIKVAEVKQDNEGEELVEVGALATINPALDLVDGKMIIMAPVRVLDPESRALRWQNTVVISDRDRFTLTNEELLERGWYAPALERTNIQVAEERYSAETIKGYLDGSLSGDLQKAFSEIRSIIKRYIDFSDERTYDFLACWIIGTYFFPIFSHYPYVHFTGPKGSGKSQCLHVLRSLCHNAKIAGSMTLAVQFRIIGALQPTLLFDEMENLGQTQHTELHRMLKYGFEKNGPQVWRMETAGKNMEMSCWSVYCPRAFASIEGMEEVIASRSVQVIMERSFDEEIKNRTVDADDPVWLELRDQLFLVTMSEGAKVKVIYDSMDKPLQINFSGRDWDIFKGVLAVAKAVGAETYETLISFAVDTHAAKVQKDQDNSPDMIILNHLSECIAYAGWYELGSLHQGLIIKASSQGLDLQGSMTKERFGKRLASLKVYEKRNRATRNGEKVMEYWMDPTVINSKLENHLKG